MSDTVRESCPWCGSKNLTWHNFIPNAACLDCNWSLTPLTSPTMTRYTGNQIFNALAEGDHPTITDTAVFVLAEDVPVAELVTHAFRITIPKAGQWHLVIEPEAGGYRVKSLQPA